MNERISETIKNEIFQFVNVRHPELFIGDTIHMLGERTIDWEKGERIWVYSRLRKYLFYIENNKVVGVFNRTKTGENIKIY